MKETRRKTDAYMLRFPDGMREALKQEADANGRSLNAEIVERLGAFPSISLRDWFAGQALPAVIAATSAGQHNPYPIGDKPIRFAICRDAYEMADAMLAAREARDA